ncbi:MAG: hypothetical protein ABI321_12170 [Polyangia bacterium]
MSDRDRPKRSWKEIDSQRDGSRRSESSSPKPDGADAKASKAHRAALDALFAKGEVGKYAEKLGLGSPDARPAPEVVKAPEGPKPPSPEEVARAEKEADRAALRKKILDGTTRDAVGKAFDRYVKSYGIPQEWEVLERGLEHPSDDGLAEVLTVLETMLRTDKPRRTRTLDGRLRFIAETHEDKELRVRAEALRSKL